MQLHASCTVLPSRNVRRWPRLRRSTRVAAASREAEEPVDRRSGDAIPHARRGVLRLVGAGLAAAGCRHCQALAAASDVWGYGGPSGPSSWPGTCQTGMQQSPIDIPLTILRSSRASAGAGSSSSSSHGGGGIKFDYQERQPAELLLTEAGALQVLLAPNSNTCSVAGQELELLQFHFHTPSEHAFDGRRGAMEAHLVHRIRATGGYAVVGVMMERGAAVPNSCLDYALKHAPSAPGQQACSSPVQVMDLVPGQRGGRLHYVHYHGSLTTPPCTEGVDWYMLADHIQVADSQVLDFMQFCSRGSGLDQNARPLQQLGEGLELELKDYS